MLWTLVLRLFSENNCLWFFTKILENTLQIWSLFTLDIENIKCLVYTQSCLGENK